MNNRRTLQIAAVAFTALAFGSFTAMDSVPDRSATQDWLHIAGYVLCAAALVSFFKSLRSTA